MSRPLIDKAKDCVAMADTKGLQVSGPNIKITAFYAAPALLEELIPVIEQAAIEKCALTAEVERLRRQLADAFMAGWEEGVNGMDFEEAGTASVEVASQFAKN